MEKYDNEKGFDLFGYYRTRIDRSHDMLNGDSSTLNKYLITLSSGAIGISISYVLKLKDMHSFPESSCTLYFLYGAWITFILTIVLALFSYYIGMAAHTSMIDKYKSEFEKDEKGAVSHDTKAALLDKVNNTILYIEGMLFVIGIVLLIVFSAKTI